MSCSQYDWKAYALGEMTASERNVAEGHAATCAGCREELAGLRLTLDAMSTLREEEVPRRIAFVSDKVFEPRWWQRPVQWLASPTFAAAMVIAAAILVHAFARPRADPAAIDAQVNSAVTKAVATIEAHHEQEAAEWNATYTLLNKQFLQVYKQTSGLSLQ
jgi:anti-sigma factor RsiW